MRYLAWASLRHGEMCGKIRDCEKANSVACQECGEVWIPADIRMPMEGCPGCGTERKYTRMRCADCPTVFLEAQMESDAGRLFNHTAQIAAMLEHGIKWGVDELSAPEYATLQHIWNEQNRWKAEMAKRTPIQ